MDKLFESLYTKNYLPPLEPVKPEPKPPVQEKEEIKEEVKQSFLLFLMLLSSFYQYPYLEVDLFRSNYLLNDVSGFFEHAIDSLSGLISSLVLKNFR